MSSCYINLKTFCKSKKSGFTHKHNQKLFSFQMDPGERLRRKTPWIQPYTAALFDVSLAIIKLIFVQQIAQLLLLYSESRWIQRMARIYAEIILNIILMLRGLIKPQTRIISCVCWEVQKVITDKCCFILKIISHI